ncbi:MAG: hypothetical protein IJ515_02950 [Clostridia bacterium]|nr:hypothetical protein [Clostridia bacterium]
MSRRDAGLIDKNFDIPSTINRDGMAFYDAEKFDVYGVTLIDGIYRRMRASDAAAVNEKILMISTESAGGRIRFATDSARIALYAEYESVARVPNYSLSATMGFDLYSDERFVGVFVPPIDATDSYESMLNVPFSDGLVHEYTVNFPICSEVKRVLIGVNEGSQILSGADYKISTPVVFYGSSVTQGSCASHPGNSYVNMVSRALDCNYINMAFWGNARGEESMARYIASMEMSAFVYDYDYNAPTPEHLEATHERMFRVIREAQPLLPVVIMSAPKPYPSERDILRERIIYRTYENARERGDGNVYFLSGTGLLESVRNEALADNIHPGDIGFFKMAEGLIPVLKKILYK